MTKTRVRRYTRVVKTRKGKKAVPVKKHHRRVKKKMRIMGRLARPGSKRMTPKGGTRRTDDYYEAIINDSALPKTVREQAREEYKGVKFRDFVKEKNRLGAQAIDESLGGFEGDKVLDVPKSPLRKLRFAPLPKKSVRPLIKNKKGETVGMPLGMSLPGRNPQRGAPTKHWTKQSGEWVLTSRDRFGNKESPRRKPKPSTSGDEFTNAEMEKMYKEVFGE